MDLAERTSNEDLLCWCRGYEKFRLQVRNTWRQKRANRLTHILLGKGQEITMCLVLVHILCRQYPTYPLLLTCDLHVMCITLVDLRSQLTTLAHLLCVIHYTKHVSSIVTQQC